jgi:hypothetical protein
MIGCLLHLDAIGRLPSCGQSVPVTNIFHYAISYHGPSLYHDFSLPTDNNNLSRTTGTAGTTCVGSTRSTATTATTGTTHSTCAARGRRISTTATTSAASLG